MICKRLLIALAISWSSISFSGEDLERGAAGAGGSRTMTAGAGSASVPSTFTDKEWANFERDCQHEPMKDWLFGIDFTKKAAGVCERLKGIVTLSLELFMINPAESEEDGVIVPLTLQFQDGAFAVWIEAWRRYPGLETPPTDKTIYELNRFFPASDILGAEVYYRRRGFQVREVQKLSLVSDGEGGVETRWVDYDGSNGVHLFPLAPEFSSPSFLKINFALVPVEGKSSMRLSFQPSLVNLKGGELLAEFKAPPKPSRMKSREALGREMLAAQGTAAARVAGRRSGREAPGTIKINKYK